MTDQPTDEEVLLWLRDVPEYRKLIKKRISDARKRQMEHDRRIALGLARRGLTEAQYRNINGPVDNLGREVEGCG